MTLNEVKLLLKSLKLPVAYDHFNKRTVPPYIIFLVKQTMNRFADNTVIRKMQEVNIELYTKEKDVNLEESLEKVLNDNEIPYEIEEELFIEEENVYEIVYKIMI